MQPGYMEAEGCSFKVPYTSMKHISLFFCISHSSFGPPRQCILEKFLVFLQIRVSI
jgi:hypothetical protein